MKQSQKESHGATPETIVPIEFRAPGTDEADSQELFRMPTMQEPKTLALNFRSDGLTSSVPQFLLNHNKVEKKTNFDHYQPVTCVSPV